MKTNVKKDISKTVNLSMMTRSAMFAAVFAVLAQISIPLPATPVPITLQTLGIMLGAVLLSPVEAVCSVGIYILIGLTGLPVFSRFMGGMGVLAGPTGGFIVSWLPAIWFMSWVLHKEMFKKMGFVQYSVLTAVIILFTLIVYGFGLGWFMISQNTDFYAAAAACALPYLPGDALKGVAVVLSFRGLLRMRVALAAGGTRA